MLQSEEGRERDMGCGCLGAMLSTVSESRAWVAGGGGTTRQGGRSLQESERRVNGLEQPRGVPAPGPRPGQAAGPRRGEPPPCWASSFCSTTLSLKHLSWFPTPNGCGPHSLVACTAVQALPSAHPGPRVCSYPGSSASGAPAPGIAAASCRGVSVAHLPPPTPWPSPFFRISESNSPSETQLKGHRLQGACSGFPSSDWSPPPLNIVELSIGAAPLTVSRSSLNTLLCDNTAAGPVRCGFKAHVTFNVLVFLCDRFLFCETKAGTDCVIILL